MTSFESTGWKEPPTNSLVGPLLTDLYQISMAYGYWRQKKADDPAVFELFFRKNPFDGEYCIFAGQDEVLRFVSTFHFSESDIAYLRDLLPSCDPAFFEWLSTLDCSQVTLHCIADGSVGLLFSLPLSYDVVIWRVMC